MATEAATNIADFVKAELVDCTPVVQEPVVAPVSTPTEASPVQAARTATIEQTGADPPPCGSMLIRPPRDRFPLKVGVSWTARERARR